jgi:hypothetical protein
MQERRYVTAQRIYAKRLHRQYLSRRDRTARIGRAYKPNSNAIRGQQLTHKGVKCYQFPRQSNQAQEEGPYRT